MKQGDNQLVLCVDSERTTLARLDSCLTDYGFSVITATTARQALVQARCASISLIIMDLNLPDMGGLELLKQLKEKAGTTHIPVIILTSGQEEPVKVIALELGADDYLIKPFSIDILAVRIKTILNNLSKRDMPIILTNGPLTVDRNKQEAFLNGERLPLETREFTLLRILIENMEQILTEQHLANKMWGYDYFVDHYAVYYQFKRLKAKLGEYGFLIESFRKVEFRMIVYSDEDQ